MEEGVKGLWGDGPWFSGNPLSEEFESSVSDAACLSAVSHEGEVGGCMYLVVRLTLELSLTFPYDYPRPFSLCW